MTKMFKTTVTGIGPWCVEFDDGEIIHTRTKERAAQLAAIEQTRFLLPKAEGSSAQGSMCHMAHLEAVAAADVGHIREKEETYRGSWKRRGGIGAFMMLARKWDRLEGMMSPESHYAAPYDIFKIIESSPGGEDGTALAEVRDLRRYLLLVEAEMVARGHVWLTNYSCHSATERPCGGDPQETGGSELSPGKKGVPRTDSNKHSHEEFVTTVSVR